MKKSKTKTNEPLGEHILHGKWWKPRCYTLNLSRSPWLMILTQRRNRMKRLVIVCMTRSYPTRTINKWKMLRRGLVKQKSPKKKIMILRIIKWESLLHTMPMDRIMNGPFFRRDAARCDKESGQEAEEADDMDRQPTVLDKPDKKNLRF